jgi:hypothetical protein
MPHSRPGPDQDDQEKERPRGEIRCKMGLDISPYLLSIAQAAPVTGTQSGHSRAPRTKGRMPSMRFAPVFLIRSS